MQPVSHYKLGTVEQIFQQEGMHRGRLHFSDPKKSGWKHVTCDFFTQTDYETQFK